MKKIGVLVLAVFMMVAVLAGCSTPETTAASTDTDTTAAEPAADDATAAEPATDAATDDATAAEPAADAAADDATAAEPAASDGDFFVGLAFGGLDATPTVLMEYQTAYMDELGWKYTVVNGDLDVNKYVADVENLVLQQPDIILARPMSDLVTEQVAKISTDAGIPFVQMGISMFSDEEKFWLGDVGDPELLRGIPLGEWISAYCKENPGFVPKIGFLVGDASIDDANICARSTNVREQLDKDGIEYVDVITAEADPKWSASGGMKIAEDWIQRYTLDEMNTLLVWSDEMCVGVIQALQAAGKNPGDYLVLSYDGLPVIEEYVADGWIQASSAYDLEKQAIAMIDLLGLYKDGKEDEIKKRNYTYGIYVMDQDSLAARDSGEELEYFDYSGLLSE